MSVTRIVMALALTAAAGCATSYSWSPRVPTAMRTVSVPTFRNESMVTEIGSVMSRQVAREFQREGTFRLASHDEAALEVQGCVKSSSVAAGLRDRRSGLRAAAGQAEAEVEVSVVDRRNGKILIDNRTYKAVSPFTSTTDYDTALRDASGRLADDLSRQVVDDVLNLKW